LQAPPKERYREQPRAALITLKAQGRIGEGISCKVETGRALAEAGLHPATSGNGSWHARETWCWKRLRPVPV
jgi:hypothetical protein